MERFDWIQDTEEVTDCMDMWSRLITLLPIQYEAFPGSQCLREQNCLHFLKFAVVQKLLS